MNYPQILLMCQKYLIEPGSILAHKLLHTHYNSNREKYPNIHEEGTFQGE